MKLIFSRKGFDSQNGGVASPIFPDGRMVSLPIPDSRSAIKFKDLEWDEKTLGPVVEHLTRGKYKADHGTHHDPDLRREALPRQTNWLPAFGQGDAAQTHLENQGVTEGDIFLFFGWFRRVELRNGRWFYQSDAPDIHVLFGWLQVGKVFDLENKEDRPPYSAGLHPHLNRPYPNNALYLARPELNLPKTFRKISGGGAFPVFKPELQLTHKDASRSTWSLPAWLHPAGRNSSLTYHGDQARWKKERNKVLLTVVDKGQEFVLDCNHYPEACGWLANILG